MVAGFPWIQCYGRQQCHTRLDQTASDRCLHIRETEGHCFARLDAFSGEIHSASQLKEIYEKQRQNINYLCFFFKNWYIFEGSLASLAINEYTPLLCWGQCHCVYPNSIKLNLCTAVSVCQLYQWWSNWEQVNQLKCSLLHSLLSEGNIIADLFSP